MTGQTDLKGMRVLIVEDTLIVAEMLADMLGFAGVQVVGPVSRVESGVALAQAEQLDGALLDVNLDGRNSGPIAEALQQRGVPFIFLTGYSDAAALPARFRDAPRLVKPFEEAELEAAMAARFRVAA